MTGFLQVLTWCFPVLCRPLRQGCFFCSFSVSLHSSFFIIAQTHYFFPFLPQKEKYIPFFAVALNISKNFSSFFNFLSLCQATPFTQYLVFPQKILIALTRLQFRWILSSQKRLILPEIQFLGLNLRAEEALSVLRSNDVWLCRTYPKRKFTPTSEILYNTKQNKSSGIIVFIMI